jgi:hypothetical protein
LIDGKSWSDGPDATVKSSKLAKEIYFGIEGQKVVLSSAIEDPLVKKGQEARELISVGVGGCLGDVEIELKRSTEAGDWMFGIDRMQDDACC